MHSAQTVTSPPSRRAPLPTSEDDMVVFKNGYFSPRSWMMAHLAATDIPTKKQCHQAVFVENPDLDAHFLHELTLSCRKLSYLSGVDGEERGLVMALAHVRHRVGWHDKTLLEVAWKITPNTASLLLLP